MGYSLPGNAYRPTGIRFCVATGMRINCPSADCTSLSSKWKKGVTGRLESLSYFNYLI
jgi:hypothetical protein